MTILLRHIFLLTFITTAAHLAAVAMGWYAKTVWAVDGPLHFFGGILAVMIFLWFAQKNITEQRVSPWCIFFAVVGAALGGSFLWELFEFSMLTLTPAVATQYKLYSTTPGDVLSDLGFGVVGGVVFASIFIRKIQHRMP